MNCDKCKIYKSDASDGTCLHRINNECPCEIDDEKEFYQDLLMEQQEQM